MPAPTRSSSSISFLALALLLVAASGLRAPAQEATNTPVIAAALTNAPAGEPQGGEVIDLAWVELQMKAMQETTSLDESARVVLTQLYQTCRDLIKAAEKSSKARDEFAASRAAIPDQLAQLSQAAGPDPLPEPAEDAPLKQLEEALVGLEDNLAARQNRLRELEALPQKRTDRAIEIARELAQARAQLQELAQPAKADARVAAVSGGVAASEALRSLRIQLLQLQIEALNEESRFYEAGHKLIAVELEHVAQRVQSLTEKVTAWRGRISRLRQGAIAQDLAQWAQEAQEARRLGQEHPLIVALIKTNQALVVQRGPPDGLAPKIDAATQGLSESKERLRLIEDTFRRARSRLQMIDSAGVQVDEAVGHLLRQEYRKLPAYEVGRAQLQDYRGRISSTLASLVQLQDRRTDLHFTDARAGELVAVAYRQSEAVSREDLLTAVTGLLVAQRDYLDRLIDDYNRYLQRLLDLEVTSKTINEEVVEFERFISERVLWIRSAPPWNPIHAVGQTDVFLAFWPVAGWLDVCRWLAFDVVDAGFLYGVFVLAYGGLVWGRRRLRARLEVISERLQADRSSPLSLTVEALLLTCVAILRWALPGLFIGWRLSLVSGAEHDLFVRGLGQALISVSSGFLVGWLLRECCRPGGLAEVHFGWLPHNTRVLHRNLTWAVLASLPFLFVIVAIEHQGFDASVGQGFFIIRMLILLAVVHLIFHPRHGLQWGSSAGAEEGGLPWQGRFYYALAVSLSLLLIGAALLGYYYSALEVGGHLKLTLWTILGCVLLRSLILRWLEMVRHRVVVQERQRRREQEASSGSAEKKKPAGPRRFSLFELLEQSRSLMRTGLWLLFLSLLVAIWSDVFPAFSVLDRLPVPGLGTRTAAVTVAEPASVPVVPPGMSGLVSDTQAPGATTSAPVVDLALEVQGASVADLLVAVVIVLVGIVVMNNLPGLLHLILLNRLDLQPGVGYAVATLVRYTVALFVALVVCAELGITWAKVQWIAAAFSLGIAFGLQEMFANFFSGLIILFERPIRIGDIVTVGDVSGNVTRINIRATTITDWDRREFLVPNKDFITGKLLNWTLTDPVTRVMVPVGIAYGSDTDRAEQLLLEAAGENPHVMAEPPPRAIFWGFGDNALEFRLYVHIPRRNFYFDLLHGLTTTINRKFVEAGISIAFPQRDVHLHPTGPLEVRVLPGEVRGGSGFNAPSAKAPDPAGS